ncbi:hypothetical protein G9C85_02510 [Halorubellus sp. JP-L1]|uniref:hypothetical protein n=1 Tax=Halorubellus sp. JP-L1 TaxID=2715753 RepID=UPI00140E8DA8|nr:hypothetical protein [Halorubellus sp. JP-L1]NHN40510.1 hypothetical protein [Halorubellus sp. JP-L1]
MSTDSSPEYSPLGRARDDLEARQRQVALLELLADRGIQLREASISNESDTDGTPVYLDVVVPAGGLQDVVDPIPSAQERGLVNKIVPSPVTPEEAVDFLDDYVAELDSGLDTLHEDVLDLEERLDDLDTGHEADRLRDIESSIQGLEAHVDAISKRCDHLDQRLDDATSDPLDDINPGAETADTPVDGPTDEDVEEAIDDATVEERSTEDRGDLEIDTVDEELDGLETVDNTPTHDSDAGEADDDSVSSTPEAEAEGERTKPEIVADIIDELGVEESSPCVNWTKGTWETLADRLDVDREDADTKDDVIGAIHDTLDLDSSRSGAPLKDDAQIILDALQDDSSEEDNVEDTAEGRDPTVASGEDADEATSDTTESAEHESEETDDSDAPESTMYAPKEEILDDVCLALGVAPPENDSGTVTHRVARDIAAKLDDRDPDSLQLKDKHALFSIIGNTVQLGNWRGRKPDLEAVHDQVVPEARQSGEMTFEEIAAEADIPAWMDEASFHVAAGDADSIRELAHDIGWERDLDDLRRITYFAGAYDGLPEPEAKTDAKYAVAGGGA